jgi:hypothetical protein
MLRYKLVIDAVDRAAVRAIEREIVLGRGITMVEADGSMSKVQVFARDMAGMRTLIRLAALLIDDDRVIETELVPLNDVGQEALQHQARQPALDP